MQQDTYDVGKLESVKIFIIQDHLQSPHTLLRWSQPSECGLLKNGKRYTENGELILNKKGDDYYFFPTEDGEPIFDDTGQKRR